MQEVIRRLSSWAYDTGFLVEGFRSRRMEAFVDRVAPPAGARIIDLGGTDWVWKLVQHDYHVTIVNLPNPKEHHEDTDQLAFVDGDATDLRDQFPDQSFDIVFSNSVIEHVGGLDAQARFRDEVLRLAPAHWIQTPSDRFPLEVHTGVPYYWRLPDPVRHRLQRRWRERLPGWASMIEGTTVLSRARMRELFPGSEMFTERVFGLEKSYAAYARHPG